MSRAKSNGTSKEKWNNVRDTITFKKTEIAAEEKPVTKRNCLAYLAQLWDPTGLVTPTTIKMRINLQESGAPIINFRKISVRKTISDL